MYLRPLLTSFALVLVACGSPDDKKGGSRGGGGGDGDGDGDGDAPGDGDGDDPLPPEANLIPLPEGSREVDYVVNLVDADAAQDLANFMTKSSEEESVETGLEWPAQLFYQYYFDEYDFLFFLSPETLNPELGGRHATVTTETLPGTGIRSARRNFEHGSAGRLLSAIGADRPSGGDTRPPFAHETMHRWGIRLDDSLGFGDEFVGGQASHWGTSSVNGILGGFDGSTLRCFAPAGSMPPCAAEADGTYRYVLDDFSPLGGDASRGFAPLELYLMGLMSADEVPQSYTILTDALPEPIDEDPSTGQVTIEAGEAIEVTMSDIIAAHGPRALLPESERAFRMAVVVLTASPASDDFMAQASAWAESYGGGASTAALPSFETMTQGRATMDTRLGARRQQDSAPDEAPPFPADQCSVYDQNCGANLACYEGAQPVCLVAGTADVLQPCEYDEDCAPGLGCSFGTQGERLCSPYCSLDSASPIACSELCPSNFIEIIQGDLIDGQLPPPKAALCTAGSGTGSCNPLLQDCGEGRACQGGESPSCGTLTDSIAQGQACFFAGTCDVGLVCVGVEGASESTCQPFCDPAPGGEKSCDTICALGTWSFDGYGVCIPPG